ncbi:MAG: RHS repeat-associated core domain-containing protein [Acidobacteria bacterium]|nr:MAG: RHS repeat-associated core domain-containing protein [Acidobacteriota bacterium]
MGEGAHRGPQNSLSASANSPFTATPSGSSLTGGSNPQPPPGAYSLSSVSYAPDGDLLSSTDSANGSFSFGYNDLNQLVSAACSSSPCTGDSASYAYDRYGNRWSESGTLPAAAPTALSFSGSTNRISGWSYDANGNLLGDGVHSYQYDAENRLISVDNGSTASYVYGPEGRRVHEDVGGVVKEFVYGAGGQELTVVNASQGLVAGETYLGSRYLGTQTASAFVWAASDELGTVRVRTNASGAPIETDTSWPFGAYLNNVGSVSNLHFTGKYRDGSSGLDYFGARYYDSGLGRFLTPDWSAAPEATPYVSLANPQSLNPYAYVLNNPTTATDPDGHCFLGLFGKNCSKSKGGLSRAAQSQLHWELSTLAGVSVGEGAIEWGGAAGVIGSELGPGDLAIAGGAAVLGAGAVLLAHHLQSENAGDKATALLPPKARKILGGLAGQAAQTVRDVIRGRGGNASNVNETGHWADRTLGQAAEAAANGDRGAAKAVKITKDAARLAQKH